MNVPVRPTPALGQHTHNNTPCDPFELRNSGAAKICDLEAALSLGKRVDITPEIHCCCLLGLQYQIWLLRLKYLERGHSGCKKFRQQYHLYILTGIDS